jgi:hypothetical protein
MVLVLVVADGVIHHVVIHLEVFVEVDMVVVVMLLEETTMEKETMSV